VIEIIPNWHPIFVHFTLALWTVATGFFLVAMVWNENRWRAQWLHVARWNLWLGALFALATAVAGWLAYNSVSHDAISHVAMTEHRNWALATLAVMLPLSAWCAWRYRRARELGPGFAVLLVIGLGLLGATGWHGGELVYRYGLGVMSLPAAEGEGHDHEHANGETHTHEPLAESSSASPETSPAPIAAASQNKTHVHKDGSVHQH
jgi:uncharacterized membrane protein